MGILLPLAAGYALGKLAVFAYNTLLTPQERQRIQNKVKTHHFEYGVATTATGVLTKSPTAVGTGVSWIIDDWKDKDVAIQNMKNKVNSTIDKVQKLIQNPNKTSNAFYINQHFLPRNRRIGY